MKTSTPFPRGIRLSSQKRHSKDLYEISEDDLTALQLASKKIIQAISAVLKPTGVACVQLNGKGVNQVVLHYHLHLIPRVEGSLVFPATAWEIKPGDMDRIRKTGEKIAAALTS